MGRILLGTSTLNSLATVGSSRPRHLPPPPGGAAFRSRPDQLLSTQREHCFSANLPGWREFSLRKSSSSNRAARSSYAEGLCKQRTGVDVCHRNVRGSIEGGAQRQRDQTS